MTIPLLSSRSKRTITRLSTVVALVGACTVVDKGDYTFTDDPDATGGEAGADTGGRGGSSGSAGDSGEGGDDTGGTAGNGGTAGSGGMAGAGDGGGGGDGPCDPNPCKNGGGCTENGTTFTCDCAPGYEGDLCGDEIDECDPNPCKNMEACEDRVADFVCMCSSQMTGKICEIPRFQPAVLGQSSTARAVSADGTVVLGSFVDGMNLERPFIWTFDGGPRPLPLLSQQRDANVTPFALSGNGERWVGQARSVNASASPPFPAGGTESSPAMMLLPMTAIAGAAFDINGDGTVAVGYFTDGSANGLRGARWDATGMGMPLPSPGGFTSHAAGAVTRDGRFIAGTAKDTTNTPFVVFWGPQGTQLPPTRRPPIAASEIEVHGVNGDGMTVAGTIWDPAFSNFAFMSTAMDSGNIRIPTPMSGMTMLRSNIWDVSDDGQVLVGDVDPNMVGSMGGMPMQATIWKPDGSAQPLMAMVMGARIDPLGWQLTRAYGVSADGKVIVGEGQDPGGARGGFILRLP